MTTPDLTPDLNPTRAEALLNILIHHETYHELRDLRQPGCLAQSGPPFKTTSPSTELNTTPVFHTLFTKFVVPLPGLRDVSQEFWQAKCQEIIEEFARADLSESYEAGYIGIRKTLATAAAALIEAPARGLYAGFARTDGPGQEKTYDTRKPQDVIEAFDEFLQRLVYDDLLDKLFIKVAETDKLEDHEPLVQAAHEYMLIIVASFLHYILIISPEGQTLLIMLKKANAIMPYTAIRQTLKVGNVATMIHGMVRIFLTKMSINSVTTFLGLTHASDAGWNLLQTIISTVVNWDTGDLKRRAAEIEKLSDGPNKAQLEILSSYIDMSREEHEKCRTMSEAKAEPIVATVLDEYGGDELSDAQIPLALEYLSIRVSVRDRRKITGILCSRQPDILSQAIRECIAAYDPVIRALHNAVDLSGTVSDLELFLSDLLKFAPSEKSPPPSVEDFVRLLRKHQGASHRFVHQLCKNGPEVRDWYKEYAREAIANFRVEDNQENGVNDTAGAGKLTSKLKDLISSLSGKQRTEILSELDNYSTYLSDLNKSSNAAMEFDVTADTSSLPDKSKRSSKKSSKASTRESSRHRVGPGPGVFLRRWQAYVNETSITPVDKEGRVRRGGDPDVVGAGRGGVSGAIKGLQVDVAGNGGESTEVPSCKRTVDVLGGRFRDILRGVIL